MISQDDIAKMSLAERLALIGDLWDSMASSSALPTAQQDELLRRLDSFEDDKAQAKTWDALKRELDQRAR